MIKQFFVMLLMTLAFSQNAYAAVGADASKNVEKAKEMTKKMNEAFAKNPKAYLSDINHFEIRWNNKGGKDNTQKLPWVRLNTFFEYMKDGKIQTIALSEKEYDNKSVVIQMKTGEMYQVWWPWPQQKNEYWNGMFSAYLGGHLKTENDSWFYALKEKIIDGVWLLLMMIIFVVFFVWFNMKASRFLSSPSKGRILPAEIDVCFDDIAGVDEAKRDVQEVAAFLNDKQAFNELGAKIPKGILLIGEPGGGKTMMAKAFAKASNAAFFQASGSEFVEMYVGLGAARVRSLFKKARKYPRAVIFIDEIDAVGKRRGGYQSNSEVEQTLNQLLVEMDGFDSTKTDIVIIAASNRLEVLDEALLRPGRFDRHITVNKPSMKGRADIFGVYLKKVKKMSENVDVNALARLTVGFSAAQIANMVNEALMNAAKRKGEKLEQQDLISAKDKIIMGAPRLDIDMIEAERNVTAIHEAGHAIVALDDSTIPIEAITIRPRSNGSLGFVLQIPTRESFSVTKGELETRLKVLMGGRAAEEIFLNKITTGASSDMEKAYDLARSMVTHWGFGDTIGTSGISDIRLVSDGTRQALEQEAVSIVQKAYKTAKDILEKYKLAHKDLTEILLVQEDMNKSEILDFWMKHTNQRPNWGET